MIPTPKSCPFAASDTVTLESTLIAFRPILSWKSVQKIAVGIPAIL